MREKLKNESKKVKIYLYDIIESYPQFLNNLKEKNDPPKRKSNKSNKIRFEKKFKIINSPIQNNNVSSICLKKPRSLRSNNTNKTLVFNKSRKRKISNKKIKSNIIFNEFLNNSFDEDNYIESIQKDKRKICELFTDSVKENNIIINTILIKNNIKPKSIKIIILSLTIILYFVIKY